MRKYLYFTAGANLEKSHAFSFEHLSNLRPYFISFPSEQMFYLCDVLSHLVCLFGFYKPRRSHGHRGYTFPATDLPIHGIRDDIAHNKLHLFRSYVLGEYRHHKTRRILINGECGYLVRFVKFISAGYFL